MWLMRHALLLQRVLISLQGKISRTRACNSCRFFCAQITQDGIYVALLNRSPGVPFGFALGTTVDNEHLIHVSNRFSERKTIASRRASGATAFRDGDVLLSVNGRSVHRMSHDQVMTLMKDETVLSLEIRRHHPDYRVVDIIRMSVDEPIGIQLASSGETSVFILKVRIPSLHWLGLTR